MRIALLVFGLGFFLIYPLAVIWPSAWSWHEANAEANNYFLMIVGIYATLGVFLIRASANPLAHASLIWFAVWSSLVHGLIMAVQALAAPGRHEHLYGDVSALLLTAAVLGILMRQLEHGTHGIGRQ